MRKFRMPPLVFIFERIFEYGVEESPDEAENYNEKLEADWFTFWAISGEEIVHSSWAQKYSESIIGEESESHQENSLEIPAQENVEESQLQVEFDGPSWQELWDEHYTQVYEGTYQLFSIVHYHHYCFFRPNTEEIFEDSPSDSEEDELEFVDQTEELKALGLPTSFGGQNNKYHSSRLDDSFSESLSDEEDEMAPTNGQRSKKQSKAKKQSKSKNRQLKAMPKLILENKSLRPYWFKRFSLFSRYDEGIQLDRESWYSVTPEKVAIHMAKRLRCDTIIDAFCGSGGNAIQFANTCSKVIAIDIDPEKIKNARHNAGIYGVADKIDFIIGDYLQLCGNLKGDVVFLSPPWGGPNYISKKNFDIETSLLPLGATALVEKSKQISNNIALFLPRNSDPQQILELAGFGNRVVIEQNFLDTRLVGLTAIYGNWLIDKNIDE